MTTTDQIQKLYTRRGDFYQRVFIDFLGWGKEIESFFRAANYLAPSSRILDAGCGTGVITRMLHRLSRERDCPGIEFHAFDITQRMLDIFQGLITREEMQGVEVRQADVLAMDSLPSHWREYDLIVSSAMLEYLPKHEIANALANLKRLLKDGGLLLAFITRRTILTRCLAEKLWRTTTYDAGEVRSLFIGAGFTEVNLRSLSPAWSRFIMVMEAGASKGSINCTET